jgi:hypothetical protein
MKSPFLTLPMALLVLAILAGCSRGPQLTVINSSAVPVRNIVVFGSGFFDHLGDLPAGGQMTTGLKPSGESSLRLEFDAGGKHYASPPEGYFENIPIFKITATIAPNFTIKVDVNAKTY